MARMTDFIGRQSETSREGVSVTREEEACPGKDLAGPHFS